MAVAKSLAIMAALFAAPVAGNMEDLLSVVNTIEQRNSANTELINEIKTLSETESVTTEAAPSALRQTLLSELREAREEMQPKPSAVRQELLAELRSARQQEQPKPSAVRQELLAELRNARQQQQPKPPSPLRQELLAELRGAREQMQPTQQPPSAARLELLAELRSAREQEEVAAKPAPSPVRQELLAELRDARENAMVEKFLDELERDEEPTPVYTAADELPWDDSEELLGNEAKPMEHGASAAEKMEALNRVLRTLIVSAVALGLAAAAKLPELDLKRAARAPGQMLTLGLFFVPLLVVSADYAFDTSLGNEFGIILACWGLAAMAALHQRGQQEKGKVAMS